MHYRIISKADRVETEALETFVKQHEKGHFLQTSAWADVKEFWNWRGILVYDEEQLVGTMSVLIRPLPMGFSVMYAPRGPVCDRNDPYVLACILGGVDDLAVKVKALEFFLDPDEFYENQEFRGMLSAWGFREREDAGFGNVQAQHVFRLYLNGKTEDSVFMQLSQKTRYNIGLSLRKGKL